MDLVLLCIVTVAVIWHIGCMCEQSAEKAAFRQPLESHRKCYILAAQGCCDLGLFDWQSLVQRWGGAGSQQPWQEGEDLSREEDRSRQRCLEDMCWQ